ncbi:MAG: Autophagy protein 7 [Alectoria sarmentosa]|nr:MAG: Autophagy protein 7 [Alectoria sarmentosa]
MLKFATFTSDIELPFYTSLASHKINHDKLDDSARRLLGLYEIRSTDSPEASCRLQIHGNALASDNVPAGFCRAEGMIKNVNTIEEYRSLDKGAILSQAACTIWDAINDGTIYSCPSLLAFFTAICFADLKKYKFTYLFAFPALHSETPWSLLPNTKSRRGSDENSHEEGDAIIHLTGEETTALVDSVQTWRYRADARQHGFFLVKKRRASSFAGYTGKAETAESGIGMDDETNHRPTTPGDKLGFTWAVGSLIDYERGFFEDVPEEDRFVGFTDPSTRWKLSKVQILCYRDIQARRDEAKSIILPLELESSDASTSSAQNSSNLDIMPKVTGWERNSTGKVMSRIANLGEYMDPQRLADQAVDLNLKLIKWRIAPGLNLDKIKDTKCLLLGAGTLGSYVARNLMGWGVRKITFVDNGSVSFSNPVRQPLFNFKDCLGGGAKKAVRASEALKEVYPGIDSSGYVMSVPMAGHPIMDEAVVKSEFETLQRLIEEHDAIFLLMDTRESRWLPTVIGKAAGKLVMNAALGFDSFVVMRHGTSSTSSPGQELGCYFCNDVVAPADSVTDRTLDQQCTVTRPGIAAIASAILVEILVSLLQHPLGASAPAPTSTTEDSGDHPLGLVPHQIRGYLSNFQNIMIKGNSYDCCSACSDKITSAFKSGGWQFVRKALNEKGFVEDLSGLAEVQRSAEKALAEMEWSDEGGTEEEGEGETI